MTRTTHNRRARWFFRSRYGHGYAGTRTAKMLAVMCPMLLAAMLLLRAFLPLPEPIRWLWAATAIFVALSVAVALILVMIGPWQHRLAGVGLGVVACAPLLVRQPAYAWAAPLPRVL